MNQEHQRNGHNPILKGLFADPDLLQVGDTYYIYPTTDGFSGWSGTQFHVFSSKDLYHWTEEGVILDLAAGDAPWAVGSAWAPAIACRNGKYYFYFCGKRQDHVSCIGVAVAEAPTGPFIAMPEPLISLEQVTAENIRLSQTIDPYVFTDEDGTAYLYFGNGAAAVATLQEDMVSLVPGSMKQVEGLYDFRESVVVTKRNEIYHFTWSCDDTGSENYHVNYGTSDSLYGPVKYHCCLLEKDPAKEVLGTGHHTILKLEGKDEYYIAYHRFGTPLETYPEEKGCHRETCIDRLFFDENNLMIPVYVTG
jgi:beta-xylosidase